jgi:diaminopimelate epimerase
MLQNYVPAVPATVVRMGGITHILAEKEISGREAAMEIIRCLHLDKEEACGVISYKKLDDGRTSITPFVWVRDTDTMVAETACASGTIALVQSKAGLEDKSVTMKVVQPSGKELEGTVLVENGLTVGAWIRGKVEIMGEQTL